MNPFYMKHVIPWMFPRFTMGWDNIKWKRTLVSVVVDTYILKFINNGVYITATSYIEDGDWEKTKKLMSDSYWY
jgi:hypothetical protein